MIDQKNIRGLIQDLSELLDQRMAELRKGTEYENARPSDAKVFMLAARKQRTAADIGKALGISKQAAHKSVQRLIEAGLVELAPAPNSNRNKIIHITDEGQKVRSHAAQSIKTIEAEIEQKIGAENKERLREILVTLLEQ